MNSFSPEFENDDKLYCITTGKPVSDDIKNDLLNVFSIGAAWRKEFEDGCFSDGDRFEKPIPRRKIKNFASGNVKLKSPAKYKVEEIKCTQDLLGRLVYLGFFHKLDPELLFPCPLTPIPLMHAKLTGAMHSTDKSKLANHLKSLGKQNAQAVKVKTYLIDAMFFIRLLVNIPSTYGGIAKRLLENLMKLGHEAERLDFIADTYKTPSLKDFEREVVRGQDISESTFLIAGPDMKRPSDFSKALGETSFKVSLLRFLSIEWKKSEYTSILKTKTLYYKFDGICYKYSASDAVMEVTEIDRLSSPNHDEADTDIIRHMYDAVMLEPRSNIAIRANDADILLSLCYHVPQMQRDDAKVWMDAGKSSDNTRCYVDIRSITSNLPPTVIHALPGFYPFAGGGDFTPCFHRKGIVVPFKLMCSSEKYINAFANLGTHEPVTESQVKDLEPFVCAMYGFKKLDSVNDCRYQIFKNNFEPKKESEPMEKIKGMNACMLPPCFRTLTQTVSRANYVASMIKGANNPIPTPLDPNGNGFILEDGKYKVHWFDGSPVPDAVWKVSNSTLMSANP